MKKTNKLMQDTPESRAMRKMIKELRKQIQIETRWAKKLRFLNHSNARAIAINTLRTLTATKGKLRPSYWRAGRTINQQINHEH
jgi:hypothetical protein